MTATPAFDPTLFADPIDQGDERALRMINALPPYFREDPTVRAYVSALALELDRLEAVAQELRTGSFPGTADLRALAYYEALFGLTNTALTLDQRRSDVVAHMHKRSVAARFDWQHALDAFIATPGGWSYSEGPSAYQVSLTVPVDPTGNRVPVITAFARAVTPAHLQLIVNGAFGNFQIGISRIGIDPL